MQSWVGKDVGNSSTLRYDKTLSNLSGEQQNQQQHSSPQSFRTTTAGPSLSPLSYQQQQQQQQQKYPSNNSGILTSTFENSSTLFNQAPHESMADGTEVLEFLNSTEYSDFVHADDLNQESMAYVSYRHQVDTQHALLEKEKLQKHWTAELLSAEDIVEYLLKADYTNDIYGIPVLGQYIKEAKQELQHNSNQKKIAVERLTMLRNHLIQKNQNNVQSATNKVFEMNESDWSAFF